MKTRVKKFKPGGFYCLEGYSSANSLFFENSIDQKLFLTLLDRFLGKMIKLHAYSTNPTGWKLIFTTNNEENILEAYRLLKTSSKKQKMELKFKKPEDMLAEHFRYFLSAYVKQSNFVQGRHGSRVHSTMKKYVFETLLDMNDAIGMMRAMREMKIQKRKYRPYMKYYLVERQLKRDSILRSSFVGLGGEKLVKSLISCFNSVLAQTDVLRQLIQYTWLEHFGPINPNFPPPKIE